jgi:hypothetical protein
MREFLLLVFDKDGKVVNQAGWGVAALLKSGAANIPRIIEAMKDVLELWELVEPLV